MNRATIITAIAAVLAFCATTAMATNRGSSDADAAAKAASHAQAQGYATGGAASGGAASAGTGDSSVYVLPGSAGLPPLPAGICQRSDGSKVGLGWGLIDLPRHQSHTDLDCLRELYGLMIQLERVKREPIPAPRVSVLIDEPKGQVCTPLARKTRLGRGCK